ncbi:MAG TPA: phosphotransferase [Solirubrobacteraceae bacterium]|jgi:aminoglycoside phosphotransferase (APT) family kinase protein|nr:phosphotransferase [Solirubrobacteraceae bacterium]
MSDADDQLRAEARRVLNATRLTPLTPLAGGASRELLGFDADDQQLVLLRAHAALGDRDRTQREWEALSAAHRAEVPVAEPLWRTADGLGIVMRRVPGEAIPRRVLRDQLGGEGSDDLLAELAGAAAAVHRVTPDQVPALERLPGSPALREIAGLEALLDEFDEPHPAIEAGLRWLRARVPDRRETTLVHGDLRLGNIMVRDGRLVALLDWELCHLGDGAEDLGWMCIRSWRFGADDRPAAGLGSRERLVEYYAAAGGEPVTLQELRWWETLANARWAVLCVRQASRHLSGAVRSHELAAIGRRACEPTWDMLELIGGADGAHTDAPQDRPDAHELLEAVADYLRQDLLPDVPAEHRFGVRIAANSIAMVAREGAPLAPDRTAQRALADAIRRGEHDHRLDELIAELRAEVRARVDIAHPGWTAAL